MFNAVLCFRLSPSSSRPYPHDSAPPRGVPSLKMGLWMLLRPGTVRPVLVAHAVAGAAREGTLEGDRRAPSPVSLFLLVRGEPLPPRRRGTPFTASPRRSPSPFKPQ